MRARPNEACRRTEHPLSQAPSPAEPERAPDLRPGLRGNGVA
jgi:hypothetical protein